MGGEFFCAIRGVTSQTHEIIPNISGAVCRSHHGDGIDVRGVVNSKCFRPTNGVLGRHGSRRIQIYKILAALSHASPEESAEGLAPTTIHLGDALLFHCCCERYATCFKCTVRSFDIKCPMRRILGC